MCSDCSNNSLQFIVLCFVEDIQVKAEDIGLNGSPTKVKSTATKQFDKTIETKELDPESAAKAIVEVLKQKYLI